MKLRVSVVEFTDDVSTRLRDVVLTVDATSTIGEVARALVRGGAGHPRLLPFAVRRQAPLTVRVTYPDGTVLILDAGDTVAGSGLVAGTEVEPVFEAFPGPGDRARSPIATLTVLSGEQEGVQFLAVGAETTVGRGRGNRIELQDSGVSRRHAVLRRVGNLVEIEDLGSANGTAAIDEAGNRVENTGSPIRVGARALVEIGTVLIQVDVGPPPVPDPEVAGSVLHLQSPRVDPVFAPEPIELPVPPEPPEPTRFPLIAMVAPLMMGAVLFATTKSLLSLLFVGLSPLIMLGSWFDTRLTRRKTTRAKQRVFDESLTAVENELAANLRREQTARDAETPTAVELAAYPGAGDLRLWSRRPEHRAFLELRLGTATLPSRRAIRLPPRGTIPADRWQDLSRLHDRFSAIPDVPLLERLDRSGSLGIAGPEFWASSVTRALLVQLLALHSPADLVFTAFANPEQSEDEWSWLKWLPHVDSVYSPIAAPHLAADGRSASILLAALEGLITARAATAGAGSVRSRMAGDAANAEERLAPAEARHPGPAVIVLVLADPVTDRSRLVGLAEAGADVGVHVLWVASGMKGIPAACRTVVEAHADDWRVHFVRQGEVVPLTAVNDIGRTAASTFARELAPIIDVGARALDESDLPSSVGLAQVVPGDVLGSGDSIVKNWRRTDSLLSGWTVGTERESGGLAAIVGQGSGGPVEIDLRTHGPHALVGGTTGAGKSEFLQSWMLSLASNHAPDRLTFLLVDYKGGAAFADCVDLPHTVGLVTDLDTHLVRRALTSLRAELRYREELLAEKSAKDLAALERRADLDAPPSLVIVIDEFAALVKEIPEFVDGVIDVAQRGRSLGLHLVMATQRPAGVITDNLRANTNLRVALRMADLADSTDVIGVADAAEFSPAIPGRAAVKVGAGRLTHLQTGYLGGRSDSEHRESVEIRDLGFGEQTPWILHPEIQPIPTRVRKGPRDIEVLTANIRRAATTAGTRRPRRPWVDPLPEVLPLSSELLAGTTASSASARSNGTIVGLIDEPHRQRQSPYRVALSEVGNVAIHGAAGTGKTTALITLAVAAIAAEPNTRIYGVDSSGGRLGALTILPNTGDIVPGDDRDRIVRLLGLVKRVISERSVTGATEPPVLLLVDGLASFRDTYEHRGGGSDPFGDLVEIAAGGRTVGVHLLLTAERSNAMPTSLASSVPERLAFRLTAETDYQTLRVSVDVLGRAGPGRAVRIGTEEEVQLALPGVGAEAADTDLALEELAEAQRRRRVAAPVAVPAVPQAIPRSAIAHTPGAPEPFAIDTVHMAPVAAPSRGLLLVTGPAGSGRTTAIRSILESLRMRSEAESSPIDAVLIAPHRSALRDVRLWSDVADATVARDETISSLIRALGGRAGPTAVLPPMPLIGTAPAAEGEQPAPESGSFPSPGARGIVVIEDIGGFEGTGAEHNLAILLKLLRRSDLTTIVEAENATLGTVWELATPLRGARWALALQPDANDTPTVFTTPFTHARRAEYPPGRGFLVENGNLRGVHIGLPDSAGSDRSPGNGREGEPGRAHPEPYRRVGGVDRVSA
ncbi:FtsK/SpoIIIE domain-containing protein [Leifsonia poae]|uniref:FtsK/SpoIIIE domain-containing protein n=1 Tax=Leifsonia poae TaxID=110933 RepID=UPI001CBB3856|nr:FtsK/SpoIIIE domain-containing protein [Leifsonia poae]